VARSVDEAAGAAPRPIAAARLTALSVWAGLTVVASALTGWSWLEGDTSGAAPLRPDGSALTRLHGLMSASGAVGLVLAVAGVVLAVRVFRARPGAGGTVVGVGACLLALYVLVMTLAYLVVL